MSGHDPRPTRIIDVGAILAQEETERASEVGQQSDTPVGEDPRIEALEATARQYRDLLQDGQELPGDADFFLHEMAAAFARLRSLHGGDGEECDEYENVAFRIFTWFEAGGEPLTAESPLMLELREAYDFAQPPPTPAEPGASETDGERAAFVAGVEWRGHFSSSGQPITTRGRMTAEKEAAKRYPARPPCTDGEPSLTNRATRWRPDTPTEPAEPGGGLYDCAACGIVEGCTDEEECRECGFPVHRVIPPSWATGYGPGVNGAWLWLGTPPEEETGSTPITENENADT